MCFHTKYQSFWQNQLSQESNHGVEPSGRSSACVGNPKSCFSMEDLLLVVSTHQVSLWTESSLITGSLHPAVCWTKFYCDKFILKSLSFCFLLYALIINKKPSRSQSLFDCFITLNKRKSRQCSRMMQTEVTSLLPIPSWVWPSEPTRPSSAQRMWDKTHLLFYTHQATRLSSSRVLFSMLKLILQQ